MVHQMGLDPAGARHILTFLTLYLWFEYKKNSDFWSIIPIRLMIKFCKIKQTVPLIQQLIKRTVPLRRLTSALRSLSALPQRRIKGTPSQRSFLKHNWSLAFCHSCIYIIFLVIVFFLSRSLSASVALSLYLSHAHTNTHTISLPIYYSHT